MRKITTKKGFTIVEVTLSLTFLSVLLITIAVLTIHVTSIYQKGLSIKAVTATGRELVDEFTRAIASSTSADVEGICSTFSTNPSPYSKCKEDGGARLINYVRYDDIEGVGNVPLGGAFCTGHYSYLWNSGYVFRPGYDENKRFTLSYDGGKLSFRLLRVNDANRNMCKQMLSDYSDDRQSFVYSITSFISAGTPEDILAKSEDNLALYRLDIFRPAYNQTTMHGFYSGTFILGTVQGGIDITASGDYCKDEASTNLDTDFNYCAINKFNFATRATGESKQ